MVMRADGKPLNIFVNESAIRAWLNSGKSGAAPTPAPPAPIERAKESKRG